MSNSWANNNVASAGVIASFDQDPKMKLSLLFLEIMKSWSYISWIWMTNISIAGSFYFRDYWGDHGFLLDNCIYVHVNGLHTATILSYEV